MTPSAVPYPPVASDPVLQWVRMSQRSSISAAPRAPIRWFASMSSSWIASASASRICSGFPMTCAATPRMRSSAHARLTAVGRAEASAASSSSIVSRQRPGCSFQARRAASTTPYAALIPIAGAPRTTISRIARATWPALAHSSHSARSGSARWSSSASESPVQRQGRRVSASERNRGSSFVPIRRSRNRTRGVPNNLRHFA